MCYNCTGVYITKSTSTQTKATVFGWGTGRIPRYVGIWRSNSLGNHSISSLKFVIENIGKNKGNICTCSVSNMDNEEQLPGSRLAHTSEMKPPWLKTRNFSCLNLIWWDLHCYLLSTHLYSRVPEYVIGNKKVKQQSQKLVILIEG